MNYQYTIKRNYIKRNKIKWLLLLVIHFIDLKDNTLQKKQIKTVFATHSITIHLKNQIYLFYIFIKTFYHIYIRLNTEKKLF